jgi:DNA-binding phage protein
LRTTLWSDKEDRDQSQKCPKYDQDKDHALALGALAADQTGYREYLEAVREEGDAALVTNELGGIARRKGWRNR